MNSFDRMMLEYYRVLNNAWKRELREAAYMAIQMLSDMPKDERLETRNVNALMDIIDQNLGNDFMMAVGAETKAYVERSLRLGIQDVRTQAKAKISIGLWGVQDQQLASQLQSQNLFWIGQHYGADISDDFRNTLTQAIEQGHTKQELADALKGKFNDLGDKGQHYWQGLAEHTALRVREMGRLSGYEKAGAQYYRLVNPMDERTSEICWALVSENKLYPLDVALEVRDNLMDIDVNAEGLEESRDRIKALAPWVKESQVEYDDKGNPTGVSGAHTPFPPFHWKCRTQTEIVI
ncbi:MAG: phage head morphogenesis protein [Candidatus Cloacimonetes bacterium]|nr:phage head morphogenesis protein [Candidatus Cloacimonadota bacterium]MCB5287507.1 phage head morphogenesis protein [Candidatus Cloacimonadota bacterium]MCK9184389.1 phage head morphogenesis protein [Candidatus Cloacimonadota bacterium]MDY0229828.1 hypothetical protein [Candidatus Cloacimonadaceae bacterium]